MLTAVEIERLPAPGAGNWKDQTCTGSGLRYNAQCSWTCQTVIADGRLATTAALEHVCNWPILLQKSFCTGDRKFCGPWTRLSCKDVRDLIASRQTHKRLW